MEDDSQHDAYCELCTSMKNACVDDLFQSCAIHDRPLESVCFTCDKLNCQDCLAACLTAFHNTALVTDESFKVVLNNLMSDIHTKQKKLIEKSSILQVLTERPNKLKSLREDQLKKIRQVKQLIVDELEKVVRENENCVTSMFDSLQKEAVESAAHAESLEKDLMHFQNYIYLLSSCSSLDLFGRKAVVYKHLNLWLEKFRNLKATHNDPKAVFVRSSVPENLDYVLKFWIGHPQISTAKIFSAPRPKNIAGSSCYIELPIDCIDIAMTLDNHVLLAAGTQGLIELCTNGQKLGQWQPLQTPDGQDDSVAVVAVLRDGRAAVGVFSAKMIFLLRRITENSPSGTTWIEDQRIGELMCPTRCLSVHGDTLAVGEWTFDEHQGDWDCGRQLKLMSLSSGELLAALSREYDIGSISVTEQAIITLSDEPLEQSSGCRAFFIDAHDRTTDLRLWRYELLQKFGYLHSIVPDSTGRVLYASIDMADCRGGRVAAISLRDGSELRQHVLRFNNRLRPRNLSLDISGTIMAALCYEVGRAEDRMVTLHTFTPL